MTARQEIMSEHSPHKVEVIEPDALVLRLPDSARIPEGSSFFEGDDDGHCRLIRPDGTRCQGVRVRAYGLCTGHAGTSRLYEDPQASRGRERRRRRRSGRGTRCLRRTESTREGLRGKRRFGVAMRSCGHSSTIPSTIPA